MATGGPSQLRDGWLAHLSSRSTFRLERCRASAQSAGSCPCRLQFDSPTCTSDGSRCWLAPAPLPAADAAAAAEPIADGTVPPSGLFCR